MELRAADLAAMARRLSHAYEVERDRLNELDAKLGDGDHGLSMARGFSAVADLFEAQAPSSIANALLEAAIGGIRKRGKSDMGQKTILDSLHPALAALQAGLAAGKPEEDVLRGAAAAAADGAERTRQMESTVGRARWFAERSRGELDPGAVSGAIIVRTVVSCLLGEG